MLLGALLVLVLSAGAGAVLASGELSTLRHDFDINPPLAIPAGTLASGGYGSAQTLLLVGDDQRALTRYYHNAVLPHANEMLLVRFDPSKPWISMMSIPRELQVWIYPPHAPPVQTRFNYAYTAGGIPLLVSTIKRVLGLPVNHVIVITFGRFRRAVDELGCVYSTVDRRYFHVNVPGGEQYQEIDLQPGYQRLCGDQALQFVSYRHDDTSLVRDARNQSFLLDVKKQYGSQLAGSIHKFEQIFGQAVQTDPALHTDTGILDLIGTLVASSGRRVRQVQFQANLLATYDTASPDQIAASVHSFLDGGSPIPGRSTAATAHAVVARRVAASLPLAPTPAAELAQARAAAARVPFALEYPRVQDRGASAVAPFLREYLIHAPGGAHVPRLRGRPVGRSARPVLRRAGHDVADRAAVRKPRPGRPRRRTQIRPLLRGPEPPDGRLARARRRLLGAQLAHRCPWQRRAARDRRADRSRRRRSGPQPGWRSKPPAFRDGRAARAAKSSVLATVGSIGGLVTLIAVPLVAILLLRRRRELREARLHVRTSVEGEARAGAILDAAGVPDASPAAARAAARASARVATDETAQPIGAPLQRS